MDAATDEEVTSMFTTLTNELLDLRSRTVGDAAAPYALVFDCCCCCCCCWPIPPCMIP